MRSDGQDADITEDVFVHHDGGKQTRCMTKQKDLLFFLQSTTMRAQTREEYLIVTVTFVMLATVIALSRFYFKILLPCVLGHVSMSVQMNSFKDEFSSLLPFGA